MKFMKIGLKRGVWFLAFGLGAATVFYILGEERTMENVLFLTGIAVLLGITSVIYETRQTFGKQILTHFIVMHGTVLPYLLLFGQFPLATTADWLSVYGAFLRAGVFLFGTTYLIGRYRQKRTKDAR